jgi:dynactin complex subunit
MKKTFVQLCNIFLNSKSPNEENASEAFHKLSVAVDRLAFYERALKFLDRQDVIEDCHETNEYDDKDSAIRERELIEELNATLNSYIPSRTLIEYEKEYRENNKSIIASKANSRRRNKIKNDPVFKLRSIFSSCIATALKKTGSKKSNSILQSLPYSILELKEHLEKQFEPWMTWENHGRYLSKSWKDEDQSTWTWQIDHIIPASTFKYTSLTDIEFQKCWSLDNLRPLSAKTNIIEGTQRTRHQI